jgi:hypothetical protein
MPVSIRSIVVLPLPEGPDDSKELAFLDNEINIVDRSEAAKDLGQIAEAGGWAVQSWTSRSKVGHPH